MAVMQDTFWWFFLNRFDVSTERSYSGKALPEQINCKRFCSIVCSGPIDCAWSSCERFFFTSGSRLREIKNNMFILHFRYVYKWNKFLS